MKNFIGKIIKPLEQKKAKQIQKKVRSIDKKLVLHVANKSRFSIPSFKQIKHLGKFLTIGERRLINIIALIIVINIIFLGFYNYNQRIVSVPAEGGSYTEGLVGTPQFINPALTGANDVDKDLTRLIYDGLLKRNNDLTIEPNLAYKYEVSEDQKEYTFYIKDNVLWHDKQKLTAQDVAFTIDIKNTRI